jgi:hypothetical protein
MCILGGGGGGGGRPYGGRQPAGTAGVTVLDGRAGGGWTAGRVGTFHDIQSRTRVMGCHFSPRYFAVKTPVDDSQSMQPI